PSEDGEDVRLLAVRTSTDGVSKEPALRIPGTSARRGQHACRALPIVRSHPGDADVYLELRGTVEGVRVQQRDRGRMSVERARRHAAIPSARPGEVVPVRHRLANRPALDPP